MKIDIWYIKGDGFHFGRHGLEQEESGVNFPSDSLFAAIVARIAVLFGSEVTAQFGKPFEEGKPPFVLTSAFPRVGDLLFFPSPQRHMVEQEQPEIPRYKVLKKVRYVSREVFDGLVAGKSMAALWNNSEKLQGKKILMTKDEMHRHRKIINGKQPIWKVERRPHVTIDRTSSSSQIYHTGRTVFHPEGGLWFGVRWFDRDKDLKDTFNTALLDLGEAGIGGERSRGYGNCKIYKQAEIELPQATDQQAWVTLSRYIPKDEYEAAALPDPDSAYSLETVRGWIGSPDAKKAQRRRSVTMLAEGSLIGAVKKDPPGQMVDVQPKYEGQKPINHPVWRNGFALAVGMQM